MKSIFSFILSIILTSNCLSAQGEFVVEYNLENGTFEKVSQKIDDVTYISPGYNTYNENAGIFYFISSTEKRGIYAIDSESGEELFFHQTDNLKAIEYSHVLDQLFCIRTDQSINKKFLSIVDLATGQVTDISDPIESSSMYQGYDSFNEKDTIFTFLAPSNILYSIHAVTGEILHQPNIQTQTGEALQHMEYYHETGVLYALISIGSGSGVVLATMDTATGEITKSANSHFDLDIGGSSAMDQNNGYYMYKYRGGGPDNLVALDINTGEVVFSQLYEREPQDNLIDIEYDNVKQKLYSKHWDSMITNVENVSNVNLDITPNPAANHITIQNLDAIHEGAYLDLHDKTGKTIIKKHKLSSPNISLPLLVDGIYFLSIYSDKKHYHNSKVVIQN